MKKMDWTPILAIVFVVSGAILTWYLTYDFRKQNKNLNETNIKLTKEVKRLNEQIRDLHTGGDSFLDVAISANRETGILDLTGVVKGKYAMRDVKIWFIYHPNNEGSKKFTLSELLTARKEIWGNITKYKLGTLRTENTLRDWPLGSFELSANFTLEIYVEAANFVTFQWIAYDGVANKIWDDIIINEGEREREKLREPRDNGFPRNEQGNIHLHWR